ncbi:uncharacterized protein LOC123514203 isoform X2 [Portunus trituberculatus]|uniref:uncharacterized protein LOC123514203 isoform X2 n=1 Tax=Portunus trituberculatus TaxID=210409 RepID=UPI001E1CBD9B|nr:uncharacterized protein LOC123514203 isoform X2 [Portunus trituberculatus]
MDKVLYEWFSLKRSGVTITGPMLQEKGRALAKKMGEEGACQLSDGWLHRFKTICCGRIVALGCCSPIWEPIRTRNLPIMEWLYKGQQMVQQEAAPQGHHKATKVNKRKDQWDKGGKGQESGEHSSGWHERVSRHQYNRPPPQSWSDRDHPRRDPYGDRRSSMRPLSPDYRHNDRGHFDRRGGYDRYSDGYYDDYYRNDPGPYRHQYDRDAYERRGTPRNVRQDYDRHPGPARRESAERYPRDRYNPYLRREAPPPPVISNPPPPEKPAAPQVNTTAMLFEGISDGSCGELLKKLSVCRVKSKEDTALAANVASYLVVSLRDYYNKIGPPTIVHILDEIILKINIMKDLQK